LINLISDAMINLTHFNSTRYHWRVYNSLCLIFLFLAFGCRKGINSPPPHQYISGKPNIVLLLGDDIGYEIPGYTGGQSYSTPNIDLLASSGMQFSLGHAAPTCSPSRFMLLTGKYNFRNYTQWGHMDLSQKTIANMLNDIGYSTCIVGKWQLDGGDAAIHQFGFDSYCVWNPFPIKPGSRYKDPHLYENGAYLPDDSIKGKYGEDMIGDYAYNFMKQNVKNSFFLEYSFDLCHQPFCPTPDDPAFATWNANQPSSPSDTMYFKSMVEYMDKKVGQFMQEIKGLGIAENTIIFYLGDNGTDAEIYSYYNNALMEGGKGKSIEAGTHVPFIVYWQGKVTAGTISNNLLDLTDFMPTIADIAGTTVPASYGTMDGTSFYPEIMGQTGDPRSWVYCYYNPFVPGKPRVTKIWAQDENYKLYSTGDFFNYTSDLLEKKPLASDKLTDSQVQIKNMLDSVLTRLQ